ncbi:unnamed protein product [Didymodactylos carnosus]|uniref:G-protein coupled receptors family 1 profile domain-containing protein n=1 Tax=Didymodactylos carnosus TaxID=1234261 RepID=A0A8S2EK69_9BILA|nr:unnamed protein product [Didymodactylos carnosus]CAF3977720.1 unnamed protein product [Didymodactylos carnosus]
MLNTTTETTSFIDSNSTEFDDWETYRSYTRFYYISDDIFFYANPILIIIGIPTHALSMIIFLRKRMCRYPVSVFMATLSLTNILILAGPVTMQWLNHKVFIGFVVTGSRFLCAFHVYIDLVGSSINSWLILVIALERYLSVSKPFLIRQSFNRRQAWYIVLIIVIVALLAPLGLVIFASQVSNCLLFYSKTYQIIGSIQIFFIYVLPSILILILSIITVFKLRSRIRNRLSRRIHISVMLIAVSFSFITFTLPFQICWYWLFSTSFGIVDLKLNIINIAFRYLALTIRNLNYTLNFFLYSLTSIVFLKEAFTIAHCNYFLNHTFMERNNAFRRIGQLLGESQQIQSSPRQQYIKQNTNENTVTNHNHVHYNSFSMANSGTVLQFRKFQKCKCKKLKVKERQNSETNSNNLHLQIQENGGISTKPSSHTFYSNVSNMNDIKIKH